VHLPGAKLLSRITDAKTEKLLREYEISDAAGR
jgi:hypothetical protein